MFTSVSLIIALLHLKRTPQSLSHDRQKGSDKIQTKDTSKRIDVFFALHDFTFENMDVLSALLC